MIQNVTILELERVAFANVGVEQNVTVELYRPSDGWSFFTSSRNKVVDAGLNHVVDMLGGTGVRPSHIGLGTGTTAVTDGDTQIETEQYRDVITRRDKLSKAIEFQLFLGLNDGNTFNYTEAGLLVTGLQNGSAGDPATLFARNVFASVTKNSSVELTLTWKITLTSI